MRHMRGLVPSLSPLLWTRLASHCDEGAGRVLIVVLRPNPVRAPIRVGNSYLVDVTIEVLCAVKGTNPAARIS